MWESGVAAWNKQLPRLEITSLVQSLELARFSNIHNANGERLGPILEAKVRRKLQDVWNDVPTLLHVSDAVRTSLRKTRAQTSIARRRIEKNSGLKKVTNDAPRPAGQSTKSGKDSLNASSRLLFTTPSMTRPITKRGHDLVLRPSSTKRMYTQQAFKCRIFDVPQISAVPTPEELARIRGRNLSQARPCDLDASFLTHPIPKDRSKAEKKLLQRQRQRRQQSVAIKYDGASDEDEDSRLEDMRKDLEIRWC